MTDAKLKSYVERMERLEEERKAIGGDVRDLCTEAKGKGYNPKALRRIVAERLKKPDEQLAADLEAYRAALGMDTYRAVAERFGVSKSKLQRLVPRNESGTPHDPITGEVEEVDYQGDDAGHRGPLSSPAEQSVNAGPPPGQEPLHTISQGEQPGTHSETALDIPPPAEPKVEVGPATNSLLASQTVEGADLPYSPIPAFLRRVPA